MARRAGKQQQQLAVVVVAVALLLLLMAAPSVINARVTCGQVLSCVTPCISYAMGRGSEPPPACCSGVSNLNAAANNTADRQATCKCLKQITSTMPALKPDIVAGIPSKCGVDIPYPIASSTDCSK
jgi:hypothetical protein